MKRIESTLTFLYSMKCKLKPVIYFSYAQLAKILKQSHSIQYLQGSEETVPLKQLLLEMWVEKYLFLESNLSVFMKNGRWAHF